jgi:hypothetical protein
MPPSEYVSRFSRNALDPVAQKIYDQLKDQRERIEKSAGPEAAAKLYTDISGLNPDESLAMMAQELQSTGITDIYKVKQDTQRIPVQMVTGESSEGGANFITSFIDPSGQEVRDSSKVRSDAQGNYYEERPQFLNTETGKPLVTSVGRGEFQNDPNILTDMGVGKRMYSGTGVRFTDEGSPIYFSTGLKRDSNLTSFLKGAAPVLGMAAGLLAGPAGLKLGSLASGAIGGGISGLAGSGGELDEALKGAALGAAMGYGREALFGAAPSAFDITDVVPANAWFTGTPDLVDELFTGNVGGGAAPPSPDYIDDVFSGSGAPTPDVASPDLFNATRFDPFLGIEDLPSGPTAPELDPTLGDPTAAPGGMPKTPPMTPAETKAALMAGGTGDPYIASEMLGSPPSSWDPSFLTAAGAGIKALLSNPVGQFIAGKALQNLLGGGSQSIQMPGGAGSGIAQPSVQYAQVPEFDVTKAFSPTLYAMRQQGAKS